MIPLLKQNHFANYGLIVFFAIAFWGFSFYATPVNINDFSSPSIIKINITDSSFWNHFSILLSLLGFIAIAAFINNINIKYSIFEGAFQIPGFVFICLTGISLDLQKLTPELFANIFLLIAVYRILDIYNRKNVFANIFDAGLFISLASFFHLNIIFIFIFAIIAIFILRVIGLREIILFTFGFAAPYIIYISYLYLFQDLLVIKNLSLLLFTEIIDKYLSINYLISLPLIILIILGLIARLFSKQYKKVIVRKNVNIITLLTIFLTAYFVSPYSNLNSMVFIYAPLSLLIANALISSTNIIRSVLFYGMIILIGLTQGLQILYYLSYN